MATNYYDSEYLQKKVVKYLFRQIPSLTGF